MKKVLVVDDSEVILNALENEFSKYSDIEVIYVKSYSEAMQTLRRHHKEIKVALLDLSLPDAPNGEVVTLANLHKIPAIVLTGRLNSDVREMIQTKEIISYILKDKSSSIKLAVKVARQALQNTEKSVLIVDDSKIERDKLSETLKKINLNVVTVNSATEALEILKESQEKFSLLITDWEMPDINGLELTIKARELYDKDELGIIALSSSANQNIIDDFLTFGANDFVKKPFGETEIIARVNAYLELLDLFESITNMANKDFLTSAYNRRYFYESGENIFLKAKRKNTPLAVAMLDIDKFKNINDTYGHDVGDEAIKEIKKILDKNLRVSDLMARFGGEEFCIVLEDISLEDTKNLFEKIRKAFEENVIETKGITVKYTVSFGISFGLGNSLDDMVKLSDDALYESKENGRNRVTVKNINE